MASSYRQEAASSILAGVDNMSVRINADRSAIDLTTFVQVRLALCKSLGNVAVLVGHGRCAASEELLLLANCGGHGSGHKCCREGRLEKHAEEWEK